MLVARLNFHAGETLCLHWRGPLRVTKASNNNVYHVEDLRNGQLDEIHTLRLKFYRDDDFGEVIIMCHVLQSEAGIIVLRLPGLEDGPDGFQVLVCWKGLGTNEYTLGRPAQVAKDVLEVFDKLLKRRTTPKNYVAKALAELALSEKGMLRNALFYVLH